jgi:phosphate transport system substrate-binding protein
MLRPPRWFYLLSVALTWACQNAPGDEAPPVRITIAGSTAMFPLLKDAADRYMTLHRNATVDVAAGGSHVGIERVAAGAVTLGASDVLADEPFGRSLVDHRVAVVGFAVMANRGMFNDAITSLRTEEVSGIFTGKYKNWVEIGGDDEPIVVINRVAGSGTRAAFAALALGGQPFVASMEKESNSEIRKLLLQTSGAVSYLALSYRDPGLKVFSYNGVAPTDENIKRGRYPLWSHEHIYTKGPASDAVVDFITFVTSGRYSREVFAKLGFIPLNDMVAVRDSI